MITKNQNKDCSISRLVPCVGRHVRPLSRVIIPANTLAGAYCDVVCWEYTWTLKQATSPVPACVCLGVHRYRCLAQAFWKAIMHRTQQYSGWCVCVFSLRYLAPFLIIS